MSISTVSRRNFLKGAGVATGGLVISVALPTNVLAQKGIMQDSNTELNAFIHLAENGDTVIYCGRCEMGQGISTALPAAVADEMEADWQRVSVKQGDADEKYGPARHGRLSQYPCDV